MKNLIDLNRNNIRTALADYRRYTDATDVLDDVSDAFVERLARDNALAKHEQWQFFCRSEAWNHDLQAIIINGTKTPTPTILSFTTSLRTLMLLEKSAAGFSRLSATLSASLT